MLNGILVVNKPTDWTSFDVIAKLRGVLKTKKIGHSGTLDPMATGVLPLFVGPCAKAVDMQTENTKTYEAGILFGKKTDTADIWGQVLEENNKIIEQEELKKILPLFIGKCVQIPPMYSAVKVNGVALYKLARQGVEVKRKEREIEIHSISIIKKNNTNEFVLQVKCSKGTYIRTLIEDIASKLGTIATMNSLIRTQSGVFTIDKALTLEKIYENVANKQLENILLSIDELFLYMNRFDVNEKFKKKLINGASIKCSLADGDYRAYYKNEFLGIFKVNQNIAKVNKLFIEREGMK